MYVVRRRARRAEEVDRKIAAQGGGGGRVLTSRGLEAVKMTGRTALAGGLPCKQAQLAESGMRGPTWYFWIGYDEENHSGPIRSVCVCVEGVSKSATRSAHTHTHTHNVADANKVATMLTSWLVSQLTEDDGWGHTMPGKNGELQVVCSRVGDVDMPHGTQPNPTRGGGGSSQPISAAPRCIEMPRSSRMRQRVYRSLWRTVGGGAKARCWSSLSFFPLGLVALPFPLQTLFRYFPCP
ncbi:hypothetical protein LY76DRAFT_414008 [Colletotrichum caudatum]|nr:hypothetical protein LY76DRAFT_414008 [Colletotrichum caudatum]